MPPKTDIRVLYLALTAGCNLRCAYCYQNSKNDRRMSWDTARGAVDLLFASGQKEVEIVFFGGEALLEFDLLRGVVEYAEDRRPPEKRLAFGLITNGTLLRDRVLEFVARRHFGTLLSFDGVPAAQDVRGRGTFRVLDRLLDRIRRDYPAFLRVDLEIGSTLTPVSLPYLADSFRYFLGKRVRKVGFNPDFTGISSWNDGSYRTLEEQFSTVVELSLEHYSLTGEVPFARFQGDEGRAGDPWRFEPGEEGQGAQQAGRRGDSGSPDALCGVMRGETPVVDVDGQVHGCASFIESSQRFTTELLRTTVESLRWGDFRDPGFTEKYGSFPESVRRTGLFHGKKKKYSSFGRCSECRFLADCSVCPTSIAHQPGNRDPDRIPDFLCAFNLVSLAARERFLAEKRAIRPPVRPLEALTSGGTIG